jgi:hypothetical protein
MSITKQDAAAEKIERVAAAERAFLGFNDCMTFDNEEISWEHLSFNYSKNGFNIEAKLAHEMFWVTMEANVDTPWLRFREAGSVVTPSFRAAMRLLEKHHPKAEGVGNADRCIEVMAVAKIAGLASQKMLSQAEGYGKSDKWRKRELGAQLRYESAFLSEMIRNWTSVQEHDLGYRVGYIIRKD